jgi:FixJ family two-component response regulator
VPQVVSIIDDDESVSMAANSLVRSLGYVTRIFASAEEFLQSPDVHLTRLAFWTSPSIARP